MFSCRVSVIIPIYNSQEYLASSLDSLLEQTIDKDDYEVLLVDDGSTDKSPDICREYAAKHPVFKYLPKENGGVSSARNFGIANASGKYFLYLDADDTLTQNTLKTVADFFDKHYDEIDLVTYKIVPIVNGEPGTLHYRYGILNHTGVYDLNEPENYYITQSTMNTCVKNLGDGNNILFDTNTFWGEDQKYNCAVVASKMKIGYCDEPEYRYYRHIDSVTGTRNRAYYIFESTTEMREALFARYPDGHVPPYMQSIVLNDFNWMGVSDLLLPYHYPEAEFKKALDRVLNIISHFDDDVIMNHPRIDLYHKTFLLGLKKGSKLHVDCDQNGIHLIANGNEVYSEQHPTIAVTKFKVIGKRLCFDAFIKSPVLLYCDEPKAFLISDGVRTPVELSESACSYYHAKIKTAHFYRIVREFNLEETKSFRFEIEMGGITYMPVYYFMPTTAIKQAEYHKAFFVNKHRISFKNGIFKISNRANFLNRGFTAFCHMLHHARKNPKIMFFRLMASKRLKKETWLYLDRYGVFDNAYIQFKHDAMIDDGIERYYVINECDFGKIDERFTPEEQKKLVTFQSRRHKYLYLSCDKLISSFSNLSNVCPFGAKAMHWYADLTRYEFIYLQHGVLHASLLNMYAKERSQIDRVVVSSGFEEENFVSKYGYAEKDLILSGMQRYDTVSLDGAKKNRILFSPSWRSNLIGALINNEREYLPEIFKNSEFFKQVSALLNSPELARLLEENDLYLDFKNHPIFECYNDLFTLGSDRISVSCGGTKIDEYKLMITDYSSIVFDSVYLDCPVIYFVPDYDMFIAGVSHNYRQLDLPLEKGFGPLTITAEELLTELKKSIKNGFIPEEPYAGRMESFFLHKDNHCCDRFYEEVTKE